MRIDGVHHRTIAPADDRQAIIVIDQTKLPHELVFIRIESMEAAAEAIRKMKVRGAPLIGAMGAYGIWLALRSDPGDFSLQSSFEALMDTRPTAINLRWALSRMKKVLVQIEPSKRAEAAFLEAGRICDEDVEINRKIGVFGASLIKDRWQEIGQNRPINILTHCNAGWLATVDWGTALAPVYMAYDNGIPVHVYVDETRPRIQGALTAWELDSHGVPYTVIADNAGGHFMQRGLVDLCLVGTDRTAANGDVCNKIGTYLKALAAYDSDVPFYVALPHPTIDWSISAGIGKIPIENREGDEITKIQGSLTDGSFGVVSVFKPGTPVANPAFDVTPARLVTGLITDRGICRASDEGLLELFPEHSASSNREDDD